MSDVEFMSHIIAEICNYAVANGMEADDTLATVVGRGLRCPRPSSESPLVRAVNFGAVNEYQQNLF